MADRRRNSGSPSVGPLTWVGELGAYIPGVPARNLSAEEAEKYRTKIQQAQRFGALLYVEATPEPEPVTDSKENDDG